jgi:hypothetical protein
MSDTNSPYILFEKRKPQGMEHFMGILHAIKNHLLIQFTYTKYWDDDISERIVEPYSLKESRYRWYLLAKDKKDDIVKSFGLDRISELEITKNKFTYPKNYNPNDEFRYSFGIIANHDKEPEEVVLSFTPYHGKYIKSFPLHTTQQIIADNEKELQIKLNIHITEDFIMEILSFGNDIKVLSPDNLKDNIYDTLNESIKKYKCQNTTNYFCKYCGNRYSKISTMVIIPCDNHPKKEKKGNCELYQGNDKAEYECVYCHQTFQSIKALTTFYCEKHPDGAFCGCHKVR